MNMSSDVLFSLRSMGGPSDDGVVLRVSHRVEDGPLLIGRHSTCQLRIPVMGVANQHARIDLRGGQFLLDILPSAGHSGLNGLILHGKTILCDGDIIEIGPTAYRFKMGPVRALDLNESIELARELIYTGNIHEVFVWMERHPSLLERYPDLRTYLMDGLRRLTGIYDSCPECDDIMALRREPPSVADSDDGYPPAWLWIKEPGYPFLEKFQIDEERLYRRKERSRSAAGMINFSPVQQTYKPVFKLYRGITVIGRAQLCEVRLLEPRVDPYHALIVHDGEKWIYIGLNSGDGSTINGKEVREFELCDGDYLVLAGVGMAFKTYE